MSTDLGGGDVEVDSARRAGGDGDVEVDSARRAGWGTPSFGWAALADSNLKSALPWA